MLDGSAAGAYAHWLENICIDRKERAWKREGRKKINKIKKEKKKKRKEEKKQKQKQKKNEVMESSLYIYIKKEVTEERERKCAQIYTYTTEYIKSAITLWLWVNIEIKWCK